MSGSGVFLELCEIQDGQSILTKKRRFGVSRAEKNDDPSTVTDFPTTSGEALTMSNEILDRSVELLEAEHRQRLEYARIEHERRMQVIEAEAAFFDRRCVRPGAHE